MAYAKINNVTNANMGKGNNAAKAALGKIDSIDAPSAAFSNAKSIDFDGSNDYMISGSNIAITRGTYQFCMKTTTATSCTPMMWSGTQNAYLVASGGELYFWVVWPMGNKLYNSGALLTDGEWHHILWTTEGASGAESHIKIYIDGVHKVTQTQTSSYSDVDDTMELGRYNPYNWYTGQMDEVAIWDSVAIDADGVTALYNSGEPIDLKTNSGDYDNASDLAHWWRMGDGDTHPTIVDNKGSNNLTMTNMASGDIEDDVPS